MQPFDKIQHDTDRDFIMTAPEAKDYGLVDDVMENREEAGDEEVNKK